MFDTVRILYRKGGIHATTKKSAVFDARHQKKKYRKKLDAPSKGNISAVSPFAMTSEDKKTPVYVALMITKRPEKKQNMSIENQKLMDLHKKTKEYDKYIPFITNMKFPNLEDNPEQVAEFYRRRWDMEVSYKVYKQIWPWIIGTNYSVRILLLLFPFILYNAWILDSVSLFEVISSTLFKTRLRMPNF